jgi:hypothetical protein
MAVKNGHIICCKFRLLTVCVNFRIPIINQCKGQVQARIDIPARFPVRKPGKISQEKDKKEKIEAAGKPHGAGRKKPGPKGPGGFCFNRI